MINNQNQPKQYDAVLGGNAPPPIHGAVLGGVEGVKKRLASSNVDVQIAALNDALNYGDVGLDLVIDALQDKSPQINYLATRVLKRNTNIKGKQALLKYNPKLSFIRLEDWEQQYYNPKIGIQNPIGTAYIVDCANLIFLLQDQNVNQVEALICQMVASNDNYEEFITFREIVSNASHQFTSLKAVFIGDNSVDESDYMKSFVTLGKVSPILNAYPQLELLQLRYGWDLQFKPIEHNFLKSLVVQTGLMFIDSVIPEICNLKLPALEYLELWLGGCSYKYNEDIGTEELLKIFTGELFPNLKYLALRSSDYSDNIALCLAEFPTVIEQLSILDLSMGTLTDKGAEALLNFPPVNKLRILDVSMNNLSENMIQKLSELDCEVIAEPQDNEELRYCTLYE